jgi:hypothetical protein
MTLLSQFADALESMPQPPPDFEKWREWSPEDFERWQAYFPDNFRRNGEWAEAVRDLERGEAAGEYSTMEDEALHATWAASRRDTI